ncbi:MAG: NAD-dependent protein deacylase [Bacillota bacterium]
MQTESDAALRFAALLNAAQNIVFFGGAGVSTESGIPDFRSAQGRYRAQHAFGHSPETILSHSFFVGHPDVFYEYYRKDLLKADAAPNDAHKSLVKLERAGKLKAVVTQNIDGLHQKAGSENVLELHGSYCMSCGKRYDIDAIASSIGVPRCACGGIIRPDVVLYEESLDSAVLERSIQAIRSADLLIVGGTSLSVYPAAGLVEYFRGKELVLINRDDTALSCRPTLALRASIGEVFRAVMHDVLC